MGEFRHKFWKIWLTSAHVIILHGAEVNNSIDLGAEVTRAEHRWP